MTKLTFQGFQALESNSKQNPYLKYGEHFVKALKLLQPLFITMQAHWVEKPRDQQEKSWPWDCWMRVMVKAFRSRPLCLKPPVVSHLTRVSNLWTPDLTLSLLPHPCPLLWPCFLLPQHTGLLAGPGKCQARSLLKTFVFYSYLFLEQSPQLVLSDRTIMEHITFSMFRPHFIPIKSKSPGP